ncbi:MAG TPA: methyltransferase domain-containing protein [Streptosporangiaceae bacterium]|nr:methyltransferase domain-containing protein [Streptosporangiaceae bacterium]
MVVPHAASSASGTALAGPDPASAYWRFHAAVRRAQLIAWLPSGQRTLIDVSGPRTDCATIAAAAGHRVIRVVDKPSEPAPVPAVNGKVRAGRPDGTRLLGRLAMVTGEAVSLDFLPDGRADGVIAADRALSTHVAAEPMLAEIARVLRPGGRVFACVDSLVLGMALLADQHHWPHLVDLPKAEVVLVPWPDGAITRCYSPDLLHELFIGAGLAVDWIRPLTALSPSMVDYALRRDPASMPDLVRAELRTDPDESHGAQLMVSARKRSR